MTPKEALAVAWAQEQLRKAIRQERNDTVCMMILKKAYEDAMVCLGYSIYFDEED